VTLFAVSIPAATGSTSGTMTAEPEPKPKPKLGPARPDAAPSPFGERPQAGEQFFQRSIADLSRRLGERAQSTSEPQTAAEARRRAMRAYERERARKLRLVLTGAGAVFATAGFAWLVVMLGEPDAPASARPIAAVQPAPPVTMASAEPATPPARAVEPPPSPPAVTESQPPAPAVPVEPASSPPPPTPQTAPQTAAVAPNDPPAPAPAPPPLSREGIREVQKRLAGFGFDPGPIDGVAGRRTEEATQRYLETRGQPQMPPNDPQMLEQLRQDPTPPVAQTQVAQRAKGQGTRTTQTGTGNGATQPARRQFDPFEPVKVAGTEITRFFQSVFR
jgi:hypothetical protein